MTSFADSRRRRRTRLFSFPRVAALHAVMPCVQVSDSVYGMLVADCVSEFTCDEAVVSQNQSFQDDEEVDDMRT